MWHKVKKENSLSTYRVIEKAKHPAYCLLSNFFRQISLQILKDSKVL